MSCGRPNNCCPPPCCAPACCPPVVIRTQAPQRQGQTCVFQLPPVNICCEIPPPQQNKTPPRMCCVPIMICEDDGQGGGGGGGCCPPQCPPPGCCLPISMCCPQRGGGCNSGSQSGGGGCGKSKKIRREKRWPQCNFLKPCIDTRIYRDGEHMTISYAGHIPGEQYIHGRNLPTTTTFAKRRLCTFTPYEYVDPDGCCSFP